MADYRWNFQADVSQGQRASVVIQQLNQQILLLQSTTRRADQSMRGMNQTTGIMRETWTHMAGVFNTWNKAVRFAVDDLNIFKNALTSVFRNVQQVGGGFESIKGQLTGLLPDPKTAREAIELSKELGRTTAFSASQAGQGAIELAKGGVTNIPDVLPAALQGAQANLISVAKAGEIAAIGMAQFSRTHETAVDILELYTSAGFASTTSIEGIAAAAKNAAPSMSLLGNDAQKTATYIALLAQKGITFGRAGTQLDIAFKRLAAPVPQAQEALKKLNISLKDIDLGDPIQVIGTFNKALQSIPNEAEKLALLKPIFGQAVTGMLPIIMDGADAFQTMYDKIGEGRGSMSEMQGLLKDTMPGAFDNFTSSIEGVWIALTDVLSLPIRTYWNTLADGVNQVTNRLETLGGRFGENAKTMDDWLAILRDTGFKGIFQGLTEEFDDEIAKLQQLATALFGGFTALAQEIWDSFGPTITDWFKNKFPQYMIAGIKGIGEWFSTAFGEDVTPVMKSLGKMLGEIFSEALLVALQETANMLRNAGNALGEALRKMVDGMIEEMTKGVIEDPISQESFIETRKALLDLVAKKQELESMEVMSEDDVAKLKRMNAEIVRLGSVLENVAKQGGIQQDTTLAEIIQKEVDKAAGKTTVGTLPMLKDDSNIGDYGLRKQEKIDEINRIADLRAYAADSRKGMERYRREEAMTPEQRRTLRRKQYLDAYRAQEATGGMAGMGDDELETKADTLQAQMDVTAQTKQWQEAQEQANTALDEAKLKIMDIGKEFKKWMLQPIDQFKQAWAAMRKQWDETVQGLKAKSLDIGQKFGLVSEEEAKKQQIAPAQESLGITDQFLRSAQTGQERMTGNEQKADQLAQLAELTGNKDYAKQAQTALEEAQRAAMEQKKIELEKIQLDRKAAEDSLPVLQDMLTKTETAGGKSAILERLQTNLMSLGKAKEAAGVTETLMKEQMKAAEENAQNLKLTAERLGLLVELAKRQLAQSGDAGEVEPTPDPGLESAPSY